MSGKEVKSGALSTSSFVLTLSKHAAQRPRHQKIPVLGQAEHERHFVQ